MIKFDKQSCRSERIFSSLRHYPFKARLFLIFSVFLIFHCIALISYHTQYKIPSYNESCDTYSRSLFTSSPSVLNIKSSILRHDCFEALFLSTLYSNYTSRDLGALCLERLTSLQSDFASNSFITKEFTTSSENVGERSKYSLIATLLTTNVDKHLNDSLSLTPTKISDLIVDNVRYVDGVIIEVNHSQLQNPIQESIDLRRGRGQRTNFKISDFTRITQILIGDHDCSPDSGQSLTAVIYVITKPDDFQQRQTIRLTWAAEFYRRYREKFRFYFVFGTMKNVTAEEEDELNRKLRFEQKTFGDLIQMGAQDGYYQLTVKSIGILRWTSLHCPLVGNILKTDVDSFLNITNFVHLCENLSNEPSIGQESFEIQGFMWNESVALRSRKKKWYTSFEDWPHHYYPSYMGSSWLFSGVGLPLVLYRASILHTMPAVLWEDLYITGIVRSRLISVGVPIRLQHSNGVQNSVYPILPPVWIIIQFNRSTAHPSIVDAINDDQQSFNTLKSQSNL